ncbi:MAG: 1-deoxy-D-xylulose-5-phosphate reductoisomerase [Pseudomonadota bacterium]
MASRPVPQPLDTSRKRRLTLLGSTGTIGASTLDVVQRNPERFEVHALAANRQVDRLVEQCLRFRPKLAVIRDASRLGELKQALGGAGLETRALGGEEGLAEAAAAPEADVVVAGIVGAAGLRSALEAVKAGKTLLLANKETLVCAGRVFMDAVRRHGATLLPLDSEHNAILQALPAGFDGDLDGAGVRRLWLTASGGPFRDAPLESLSSVTPEQACNHPNWVMGRKISVDSATMMNKGLEVIEACWLFNATPERIKVVVHPQSIVHSMVEYRDGSVIAQLGQPDMRTPIAYALGYPERIDSGVGLMDIVALGRLDFRAPDPQRFPCLALAYRAIGAGQSAPAVLNAANEVAVEAFLHGRIGYAAIPGVIDDALGRVPTFPVDTLEDAVEADRLGREAARGRVAALL